ncbi:MAG: hypothetical protein ACE5FT_04245 [Candidatus Nanoarchaeia archaeon]
MGDLVPKENLPATKETALFNLLFDWLVSSRWNVPIFEDRNQYNETAQIVLAKGTLGDESKLDWFRRWTRFVEYAGRDNADKRWLRLDSKLAQCGGKCWPHNGSRYWHFGSDTTRAREQALESPKAKDPRSSFMQELNALYKEICEPVVESKVHLLNEE